MLWSDPGDEKESIQVWRADFLCRYGIRGDSHMLERMPLWIPPGQLRTCWVTGCVVGVIFRRSSDSLAHALLLRFQLCRQCSSHSEGTTVPREPLRTLRGALCCTWDLTAATAIRCFSSPCLRFQCNCFAVMLFHSGSWWFCFHPHQLRACFRYSSNPCAAAYFSFFFLQLCFYRKHLGS